MFGIPKADLKPNNTTRLWFPLLKESKKEHLKSNEISWILPVINEQHKYWKSKAYMDFSASDSGWKAVLNVSPKRKVVSSNLIWDASQIINESF